MSLEEQPLALGAERSGCAGVDRARVEHGVQALVGEDGAALDDLELDASFGAVDRDPVALPRRVGVQRIAEGGPVGVVDDEGEVVLDRDALAEDVAIAEVAVVLLGVEVERFEALVRAQIQLERVCAVVRAAGGTVADAAGRRVLGAVEAQPSRREDPARRGADPPVHEVEVVARLVDQQAAGVALLAVPAAEVVGAVLGVEHPGEVDRGDLPDEAVLDDLAQRAVAGRVPVVEGQHDLATRALDGVLDGGCARRVDRQRLLDDHVGTRLERPHDERRVLVVARADDDPIDLLGRDHLFELVGRPGGRRRQSAFLHAVDVERRPHGVGLADRDEHRPVGVRARDRIDVHVRAVSRPDHRVPALAHQWLLRWGNVFRKRFLRLSRR